MKTKIEMIIKFGDNYDDEFEVNKNKINEVRIIMIKKEEEQEEEEVNEVMNNFITNLLNFLFLILFFLYFFIDLISLFFVL